MQGQRGLRSFRVLRQTVPRPTNNAFLLLLDRLRQVIYQNVDHSENFPMDNDYGSASIKAFIYDATYDSRDLRLLAQVICDVIGDCSETFEPTNVFHWKFHTKTNILVYHLS